MQQQHQMDYSPSNTIYLNNLPFNSGPADFEQVQAVIKRALSPEDVKNVDEIKARDRKDRPDSYSVYALVKFNSKEAMSKVLSQGTIKIKDKVIKIEPYAGEKEYHIYIKNISSLNQDQLEKYFSQFGKLDGVHLYSSEDHNSCLIRYLKQEDADSCLKAFEHVINGIRLWLDRYISKQERHEEYHRLYLNKIPVKADNRYEVEALLANEFSKFGKLARKIEIEFKDSQPKLGHSIVYFQTQEQAEQARQKFNRNLFGAEPLELDNFISKKDRDQKGQLYVSDILPNVDHKLVRELFGKYGKVEALYLNKYSNPSKGGAALHGSITFEDKNSITQVLSEAYNDEKLAGIFVDGDVKVNIFLSRQQREECSRATKTRRPPPQQNPPLAIPGMMPMFPFGMPNMPNMAQMGMPMMPGMMPGMMPPYPGFTGFPPAGMMPRANITK